MSIPVIVIPVLNRFDLLQKTLDSIDVPVDEVLIINNSGSPAKDLTCAMAGTLRVLDLPSNLGVAASWNLGIKLYPFADYWLIGSADTHFSAGTLASMQADFGKDRIVHIYGYGAFALGCEVVEQVGLFDEAYYPIYFEDWDYRDRVDNAGVTVIGTPTPAVTSTLVDDNGGSVTIHSDPKFLQRNQLTQQMNGRVYYRKVETNDYSLVGWSLSARRLADWMR